MSGVSIVPMGEWHLSQVLAIERASFCSPWSERAFQVELDRPQASEWFVAVTDEATVVGYGGLMQVGPEGHVTNLAVALGRRRQGIATRLMARLEEAAASRGITSLILEVRESNEAAIRLYEELGFRALGRRKRYYPEEGEDALIMWKEDL